MGFFARVRFSCDQTVQHHEDVISLSGQTQIATTTGLTLTDGAGGNIPVTASGASADYDVLTYCQGVISLKPTSGGGSFNYSGASPSTCEVGGLAVNSVLTGRTVSSILEEILVPTVDPLTAALYNSLSVSPPTIYEVGSQPTITVTSSFNRGCVLSPVPPYCSGSDKLAGLPSSHVICAFGDTNGVTATTTNLITGVTFNPTISYPSNYIYSCVNYSSGATPVYRSDGSVYSATTPAGATSNKTCNITGVFPWFCGRICSGGAASGANRPTACCIKDIITGGTVGAGCSCCKVVASSSNTLDAQFCTTSDDYLWFATPVASATKTWYYVTDLNQGALGGAVSPGGNLFPDPDTLSDVCSSSPDWGGCQSYKIYVSNYQTDTTCCGGTCCYNMELRNS